jgi:hypothetical protein
MKVNLDLDAIDAASDPRHYMIPFANRIRLTNEDYPTAVYAIGRKMGEVVVEIERQDATYTHLLGSAISHSPGLALALSEERLASLPAS